jgi:CBS domain containing-hemolysin-like protein
MIAYTIGEIPEQGEEIELSPYILKIKKVSATKIEQIILSKSENN